MVAWLVDSSLVWVETLFGAYHQTSTREEEEKESWPEGREEGEGPGICGEKIVPQKRVFVAAQNAR